MRHKSRHFLMLPSLLLLLLSCCSIIVRGSSAAAGDPFPDCPAVGTVSRLNQHQNFDNDTEEAEEAPSASPSQAHPCSWQISNARGYYTSTLAPCVFTFHQSVENEPELIDFQTSNLCSEENGFLIMKEYVLDWPDECVGDFGRCYSLEHHRSILFDFMCVLKWNIPSHTTHISVNCTEDKELVWEAETGQHAAEVRESRMAKLEIYQLKAFNLLIIFGSIIAGIYVISQLIVKPLVAFETWKTSRVVLRRSSAETQPLELDDSNHVEEDDSQSEREEFENQIPADFDAIPMVQAIVLPEHDFHT